MNLKNKAITLVLIMGASLTTLASTNDAILGQGDSFACDSFSRNAKVACMPNVQSNYFGRTSFPSQPALVINTYQVVECSSVGGNRDVICNTNPPAPPSYPPGPGYPPGPSYPPPAPESRRAFSYPDMNCLNNLPGVNDADQMVSNSFFRSRKLVDTCDSSRDLTEIRQFENRGFRCTVETLATNQSDATCVQNILAKIANKASIKGSHRRILESDSCATKTYNCVR